MICLISYKVAVFQNLKRGPKVLRIFQLGFAEKISQKNQWKQQEKRPVTQKYWKYMLMRKLCFPDLLKTNFQAVFTKTRISV